jgi:flavin reductase (DIM6/NTAB) family NADH-FMN oxidoreductase RutF/DNA-binding GntR family transcriptional regulator
VTVDTPAFDATVFRRVIGNFMTGVVVITTEHDGARRGMTVSAVSSLSLDPPMLLVCLNAASATQEAVHRSGRFAVNILAEHQGHIAERFARPGSDDKFAGLETSAGRTGVPLLTGVLASVECRVAEVVGGGTHRVFLAEAVCAEATEGSPLAYFRGKFGKFELGQDAEVYRRLRQLVLGRRFGPGQALQVEQLSAQLSASPSSVYYALTRLVGDRLVSRDPQHGHVVTPLDVATSDDAHDARLAIELGAAELVVGRLSAEQLGRFRELATATGAHVRDGRFGDVEGFIDASHAFHRFLVDATGVRLLVDAYEELSLPDLMAQALPSEADTDPQAVDAAMSARTVQRWVRAKEWQRLLPRVFLVAGHPHTDRRAGAGGRAVGRRRGCGVRARGGVVARHVSRGARGRRADGASREMPAPATRSPVLATER